MANWFETVTKTLGDEKLSRRKAMKTAVGVAAAAALAAVIPGEAFAAEKKKHHKNHHACKNPGNCNGSPFNNCGTNPNCYCFENYGSTKGTCGCNSYCASIAPCTKNSDCGKGNVCIGSTGCGCTSGFCIPVCNKTCVLDANRSGRTAA
jgi:hypothetical protein